MSTSKDRRRKFLFRLGKELALLQIKIESSLQGYSSVYQIIGSSARNQETERKQGTGLLQCFSQKRGQNN
jgi:hypothetical protein